MAVKKSVGDNLGLYLLLGALVLVVLFYQPGILLAPEDDLKNCQEIRVVAQLEFDKAQDALFFANGRYDWKYTDYMDLISLQAEKDSARENLIAEGSQMSRDILNIEDQISDLQEQLRTAPGDQYEGINASISALQTDLDSLERSKTDNTREVTAITAELDSIALDLSTALNALVAAIDRRDRAELEFGWADSALRAALSRCPEEQSNVLAQSDSASGQ